jgi:cell surface protein SprA
LNINNKYGLVIGIIITVSLAWISQAKEKTITSFPWFEEEAIVDSPENKIPATDTLKFPITDRLNDKFNEPTKHEFDLKDPSNIITDIDYDTSLKTFSIKEKMGSQYFRNPSLMTMDEFVKYQGAKDEEAYWKKRASSFGIITKKGSASPQIDLGSSIFDRLFGGTAIEVKPTGNIDMTFGGNWQNIQNPSLPERQRKWGIFDFDLQMNLNMLAKIGDKMRMNFSYNTRATFDFENQTKLEWAGQPDQIIRKLEAGQVAFPLKSTLIQGVQGLFGIKVQAQFGRLMTTTVVSQQKSKKESITLKGGSQNQEFNITVDQYDVNRHFLLDQTFRGNYNKALSTFPLIQSQTNITKMEVWITNRNGTTIEARDVIAFSDLGEVTPFNTKYLKPGNRFADNTSNLLYQQLLQQPGTRTIGAAVGSVIQMGLEGTKDFEKTFARKLSGSDFSFNPKLGFISINAVLNPDDVVGVAYQYTYNGKVFQVGDFAQDLPPDSTNPKVLFLKMLKSTTMNPKLPIWDLMMKNVYSVGSGNLAKEDFRCNVMYQDAAGALKRYLPEGPQAGRQLNEILNLDRLNGQNDPQPDGIFDYVEGVTINSSQGKIIFPVLEPFGEDLKPAFGGQSILEKKYLYNYLYDSTQIIAQQYPQLNRFVLKGNYKGSSGSEIYLGGFNIPQGSVRVTAGGVQLVENVDFQIDYGLGRLKILNNGYASSGIPINVSYENNANFSFQQQNLMGTRWDYFINEKTNIGGTLMRLSERPFSNKVQFGDDPIKNTVAGLDVSYQSEAPFLTRLLDKLPIYSTTAPSIITAFAEGATLQPGHSSLISKEGEVYIDDFESSRSSYDLKFPLQSWSLASVPVNAVDANGKILFPEATDNNSLTSGVNRAKICWYNLEPSLTNLSQSSGMPAYIQADKKQLSLPTIHTIRQQDVFPQTSTINFSNALVTFDLAYYPKEKGPYNFDTRTIDQDGLLKNPTSRWAGISRYIDQSDFENSNVEFIEFWVMDPFISQPNSKGGSLYINLGNISEDVLKDGRKGFENGIPFPFDSTKMEKTTWGQIPKFQQQINNAFGNDLAARERQDVGYDCMDNIEETNHFKNYLNTLQNTYGVGSNAYINAVKDPANDDYHYIRGEDYDAAKLSILDRYKKYNHPQNNSPVNDNSSVFSNSYTNMPESEDINRDNTLNENEQYFQYRVDLKPKMAQGESFLINRQEALAVPLPDGTTRDELWYQFRVPVKEFTNRIGNIPDFRSIRFMRMYLTGFEDSIVLRFARLELGRNQWRRYNFSLKNPGEIVPEIDNTGTEFNLTSVSIEENFSREPVPYVTPEGIIRQQTQISNGQNVFLNEQSIAMQVCNLEDGDSKGAFKQINLDMRQFKTLKMFTHAEARKNSILNDGDLRSFIRLGNDFTNNYYEYQVPMKVTPRNSNTSATIWPLENEMVITLQDLVDFKAERNKTGSSLLVPYTKVLANGHILRILGNPNLGDVKMAMLGVNNTKRGERNNGVDDGMSKCAELWFNELRLTGLNEKGGYAAIGRVEAQLADLGTVRASGDMHTRGYGNIDQKLNQRMRDDYYQYSASANINAGKLLPKNWGVTLPIFAGHSENVSTPQYDPYDLDTDLKTKLATLTKSGADSLKNAAQDVTVIQSINFQNVRIQPTSADGNNGKENGRPKTKAPWNISNFNFSYSFSNTKKHNPLVVFDDLQDHLGNVGYAYAPNVKSIEPFKKIIKSKNKKVDKYLTLFRDFNFKPLPSNITVNSDLHRVFGATQVRNIDDGNYQLPTTFYKFFTWSRTYSMQWNFTNGLSASYTANNQSRIDEPNGFLNTSEKKDTLWNNIKRLGRNTLFTQSVNANYTVPINKIPILDWVNLRAGYSGTYNWTAGSLLAKNLGNSIGNTQQKTLNGDFNFTTLYNKWKFLRVANQPKPLTYASNNKTNAGAPKSQGAGKEKLTTFPIDRGRSGKKGSEKDQAPTSSTSTENGSVDTKTDKKQETKEVKTKGKKGTKSSIADNNITNNKNGTNDSTKSKDYTAKLKALEKQQKKDAKKAKKLARIEARKKKIMPDALRLAGRLLSSVKRANFTYTENSTSTMPGFMDSTQAFGVNWRDRATQLPYAFGFQPNRNSLESLGSAGLLSRDTLFNANFAQSFSQNLNVTATVEPFPDMRIDLSLKRNFNKAYNELYKDTTGSSGLYHLNPFEGGGFEISFISFNTMFQDTDRNGLSKAFYDFENNRKVISNRLGVINPYGGNLGAPEDPGYAKGYTRYAQEVLIPAFLSAYSGKDPKTYPLVASERNDIKSNPFRNLMPMPNWRFTYSGLTKIKAIKEKFTNINLTHGYSGTLSMNNFNSSLMYKDLFDLGYPSFIDSNSGNYVPYFFVPNITINERFEPLIGIDLATKNNATIHFEYKKSRTLSMSLLDFQLSQTTSKEITFGGGLRLKKVRLPISLFDLNKKKNDINIKADFSLRDDNTAIQFLDRRESRDTRGQTVIGITPSIDYIYSQNLTIRFYYDRRQTIPHTTNAFPITATRGGVMLRFLLGQ